MLSQKFLPIDIKMFLYFTIKTGTTELQKVLTHKTQHYQHLERGFFTLVSVVLPENCGKLHDDKNYWRDISTVFL